MEAAELQALLKSAREKLRVARETRPRPARDDKVLTAWNGLMIGSLAYAARELGQHHYAEMAARAARFTLDNLREDGRLLRRWREVEGRFAGYLEDSVFLADGLLELHETTGEQAWLDDARGLVDAAVSDFWDEDGGGFFATAAGAEQLPARPKQALDHPLPSGNGAAALVLLRLAKVTEDDRYRTYARRTLDAMVPWMQRAPFGTDTLLLAAAAYLDEVEAASGRVPSPAGTAERTAGPKRVAEPAVGPERVAVDREPVKLVAGLSKDRVTPGERFEIVCRLEIADGWHVNSNLPQQEYLVPTLLVVKGTVPLETGDIAWPSAHEIELGGDRLRVYSGRLQGTIPVTIGSEAPAGAGQISVALRFQACDDTSCLAPDRMVLMLPITVEPES